MRKGGSAGADAWLVAAMAVTCLLCLWQLDWGLPAHMHSWAVDAVAPRAVLAVLHHSFATWNSGWFYFKYPLAYPFLLGVAFAPVLGWQVCTGGWVGRSTMVPSGFAHADEVFLTLTLVARALNVAFAAGTVAVLYHLSRCLFDRTTARLVAWLAIGAYPLIFYAHTMNVDASYWFWMFLSLDAAICAAGRASDTAWWAILGASAVLAVSTREQAFGFLLPLPILAVVAQARVTGWRRLWRDRGVACMVLAALATAVVFNNLFWNPFGFVSRLAYLLGHPIGPPPAPLKPVAFAWWKGDLEWTYIAQVWDGLSGALGTPLACVAVIGAVLLLWRRRAALWLLVPAFGYYYLSLRGQQLIKMRYMFPLALIGLPVAADLLLRARTAMRHPFGRRFLTVATGVLVAFGVARGVELDLLLRDDPRYRAEQWMATHLDSGARGEVYQSWTYLPRPPRGVSVRLVPMDGRSVQGFRERRPNFVIVSSASLQSMTAIWNPDWRRNGQLLLESATAARFKAALFSGELGTRRAAVFARRAKLLRPQITGLSPEISIFVRSDSDGPALPLSDRRGMR